MHEHRIRRLASVAGLALALACPGAVAAQLPPAPTVPLPPLPPPPIEVPEPPPLPSTPTVPLPAPEPAPTPAPVVESVATAVTGSTTAGATSSTSSGGPTDGGSSAGAADVTPGERESSTSRASAGTVGVASTKGRRGVVTVRFALARASRVVVVLRGPLPACDRVARFGIDGHRGTNALRFNGRVGNRRLAEGAYLIGVRARPSAPLAWVAVRVGPRGARPLPHRVVSPALARCAEANQATVLRLDGAAGGALPRASSSPIGGTRGEQSPAPAPPPITLLPFHGFQETVSDLPDWLGYLVLAIVTASLAAIIFLVIRFLRPPSGSAAAE